MANEQKNQILASIARQKLCFDTLETRNSDGLDFREVAVWCVREALEAAFEAGAASASNEPKTAESEAG